MGPIPQLSYEMARIEHGTNSAPRGNIRSTHSSITHEVPTMPSKAKSHRSSSEDRASEAPTAVLTAAPLDAPPSFLEKAEHPPAEQIAHGERSNLQLYLQ